MIFEKIFFYEKLLSLCLVVKSEDKSIIVNIYQIVELVGIGTEKSYFININKWLNRWST